MAKQMSDGELDKTLKRRTRSMLQHQLDAQLNDIWHDLKPRIKAGALVALHIEAKPPPDDTGA